MKVYLIISFLILSLSWTKEYPQEIIKDLELNLTKTEWNTSISDSRFGEVYLTIEGNTNAELLTVEIYGDGLNDCKEIKLDKNKNFSEKIAILFNPKFDTIPKKYRTFITVYEKSESPDIVICRTGTGKEIRKMIESDYLTFRK